MRWTFGCHKIFYITFRILKLCFKIFLRFASFGVCLESIIALKKQRC